jgi:AraC-like DNA-binding protein
VTKEGEQADRPLHFSTDFLPVRDRLPYLRETFGRSVVGLDLQPHQHHPLEWTASLHQFNALSVASMRTSPIASHRTRPLLADGNDDLLLSINLAGVCLASQAGRECRLDAGAAALMSCAEVGVLDRPRPTRYITMFMPHRSLQAVTVNPQDALARPIPANNEALRLLIDYLETGLRRHPVRSPRLSQLFTTHVYDLVALAVGATRDMSDVARKRGLQAARLSAVKGDIIAGLGSERLDVAGVARARGVTPRYVQMLFESEGTTFTKYVLEQRLTRARRMLAEPGFDHWTISAIAFEVGFGNLSYFNRVFRRTFGATPSDVRAAAQTAKS